MIVLDEQLLGRAIDRDIARWYRGPVRFILDLRPHTVIKDDGIPELLRQQSQPTFVTINERDFWQKIEADARYCIVCFPLPDPRAHEIPGMLRSLFRHPEFRTKAQRTGKVIRVTSEDICYYTTSDKRIEIIPLASKS
jgi:hypothetical protein